MWNLQNIFFNVTYNVLLTSAPHALIHTVTSFTGIQTRIKATTTKRPSAKNFKNVQTGKNKTND